MQLLAIPGRLEVTHGRMERLARTLSDDFIVHRYAAWPQDPVPDEEIEAARVGALYEPDLVLAVSLGTLVAMSARARHGLSAKAYVFLGVPLERLKADGRVDILADQARAAPTLFIQQTDDFTGAYRDLAAALPSTADTREIAGSDHVYDQASELAQIILRWRD